MIHTIIRIRYFKCSHSSGLLVGQSPHCLTSMRTLKIEIEPIHPHLLGHSEFLNHGKYSVYLHTTAFWMSPQFWAIASTASLIFLPRQEHRLRTSAFTNNLWDNPEPWNCREALYDGSNFMTSRLSMLNVPVLLGHPDGPSAIRHPSLVSLNWEHW